VTVPFPRTIPADAPTPPTPPLDWRAARAFFDQRQWADADATEGVAVVGYRLTVEGVVVRTDDGSEDVTPWAEVQRIAQLDGPGPDTPPEELSRRERRQQRRQQRRGGMERGDDS
jgi:hypothetical protein